MGNKNEVTLPVSIAGRELRLAAWQRETRSDELLVFIHGLGCSKRSFSAAWQRPELRDYSLLAIDLPGFGHSPRPADFSYDLADQARLLQPLLDSFASRRVCLIAHSMGGSLSLLLPARVLARLSSLILIEARLYASSCGTAAEVNRHDYESFQSAFLPQFRARVAADPRQAFDLELADAKAFFHSARSLVRWAETGELAQHFFRAAARSCFFYGADNSHLKEVDQLPATQTVAIPNAAHFPMHDNPDAFYSALADVLDHHYG